MALSGDDIVRSHWAWLNRVIPEKGSMVNGFLLGSFSKLDAAIEHQIIKSFNKELVETVVSCNSCHFAAGSPSTKIALDSWDNLSMRHPHVLSKSAKPGKHTHMH